MTGEPLTIDETTLRHPPLAVGAVLIGACTIALALSSGCDTESALRLAFVSALALVVAARRPRWATCMTVGAAVLIAAVADRGTAAFVVSASVLWLASNGSIPSLRTAHLPWLAAVGVGSATGLASTTTTAWGLLVLGLAGIAVAAPTDGPMSILPAVDARLASTVDRTRRWRGVRTGRDGDDDLLVTTPALPPRELAIPASIWATATVVGTWIQNVAVRSRTGWDLATVLSLPSPTTGKGGWDTLFYVNISELGYHLPASQHFTTRPEGDLVAYFPGYPAMIRALSSLPGIEAPLASIIIAATAGLAATLLMWVWMGDRGVGRPARVLATVLFVMYPWSFLLTGVAYSDPLALALVLSSVVLVTRGHHVLAGLVGAAATITRPTCLGLVVALPLIAVETEGVLLTRASWAAVGGQLRRRWGVFLAGAGIGAYALWLWIDRGDPLAFWTVQSSYGQGSAFELGTWAKLDFFGSLPDARWGAETVNRFGALLATAVVAACTPAVARRFGTGYAVWTGSLVAAVLVGARYFAPGGRYLMLAFPVAALVAVPLARRRGLATVVIAVLAAGWALLLWRFARTDSLSW